MELNSTPCPTAAKPCNHWKLPLVLYPLLPILLVPLDYSCLINVLFTCPIWLLVVLNFVSWDTSQAKSSDCTIFLSFPEHTPMSWFIPFEKFVQALLHLNFILFIPLLNASVWLKYMQHPSTTLQIKTDDSGKVRRGSKKKMPYFSS